MTSAKRLGLVFAGLIGGWHFVWVLLVLIGWAQPILNFIFWAHMIQPVYVVKPFGLTAAITLVAITAIIGYAFGLVGGVLWNKLHRG